MTQSGTYILKGALLTFLVLGIICTPPPLSAACCTNVIPNPGFEIEDASGLPTDWIRGRWGNNTAVFSYPAEGMTGSRGAKITLTNRTSGDAKWAFKHVQVTAGKEYEFSDFYKASVPTYITLQYQNLNGTFSYIDVAQPPAKNSFEKISVKFTAPPQVETITVFHLINEIGELTVDSYSLTEVPPPPPHDPFNLVQNYSLEEVGTASTPEYWLTGRWGINNTSFTFPVSGHTGSKAVHVSMSARTSGDAKWYFKEIPAPPHTQYQFSNFYKSNVTTYITVRFRLSNNTFLYQDIGVAPPKNDWGNSSGTFITPNNTVSMTVFHVIKNIGFLETDSYSVTKIGPDPTRFERGMVSLNFDDGWRSVYDNALPILEDAGFKSTQFITTQYMEPEFPGYVRSYEVLDMHQRGHEIGAHTKTHANLTTLTESAARQEITGSRENLLSIGISPVNFFAYPFGSYNSEIITFVKEGGFSAARSSDGGYNLKSQNLFNLKRQPMVSTTSLSEVQGYIDKAIAEQTWLILLFHEVNESRHQYSISPTLLRDIVAYLKQKNITPITIQEGTDLMRWSFSTLYLY